MHLKKNRKRLEILNGLAMTHNKEKNSKYKNRWYTDAMLKIDKQIWDNEKISAPFLYISINKKK